jgi:GMP synthase (glutamine-hydrolysing)
MRRILVLQHEACEHLGLMAEFLTRRDVEPRYVKIFEGENIPEISAYSGMILLGGPMSVYDEEEHPFLRFEDRLVRSALSTGLPLLGICLGAQLIAKAAGARVYPGKQKEIGWYPIYMTSDGLRDRLFSALGKRLTVFQWHGDTFDIPRHGVRLAGSALFPNQAFRIGSSAYALQFHLEVSPPMIREWFERYNQELDSLRGRIDPEAIMRDSKTYAEDLRHRTAVLCGNFVQILI